MGKTIPPEFNPESRPEFCQKRCILLRPFAFNCSYTVCELSLYLLSTTTLHFYVLFCFYHCLTPNEILKLISIVYIYVVTATNEINIIFNTNIP